MTTVAHQSTLKERIKLLEDDKRVILDEIKTQKQPVKDYRAYFRIQGKIKYYTKKLEDNEPEKKLSKVDKYKQSLALLIEAGGDNVEKTTEYKNLNFKIKYNSSEILREYHSKHNAINSLINKNANIVCA